MLLSSNRAVAVSFYVRMKRKEGASVITTIADSALREENSL